MKRGIVIVFICFVCFGAFAQQAGKCPFPAPARKVKNDQYSQSSKDAAQKSKKEMAQQEDEFDKKKYQTLVRAKSPVSKQKQVMRYR